MFSKPRFSIEDLEKWFSEARMSRFAGSRAAIKLYVWNTRMAKCLLEDIQHVEVLLRNKIDTAISTETKDPDWLINISYYDPAFTGRGPVARGCDSSYTRNINKAIHRTGNPYSTASKGRIIAELSFDHWRFLLTARKEPTTWIFLKRHLQDYDIGGKPRQNFEDEVEYVLRLRNRLSHHEPITGTSLHQEYVYLHEATRRVHQLATWIDSSAAQWIRQNSRAQKLWTRRPVDSIKKLRWIRRHPLY